MQPSESVSQQVQMAGTDQTDWFMKTVVNQTHIHLNVLVNSPANQHWHLCHLTKTLGRWWWTWHLQQQGCVLWLAGLPGVELSRHVCGWTAGPKSGEGSAACSGRLVCQVWKKDHLRFKWQLAIVLNSNNSLTVEYIIRPLTQIVCTVYVCICCAACIATIFK